MKIETPYAPPWPTQDLWQAANDAVAMVIAKHKHALGEALVLGEQIYRRIEALNCSMDALCMRTCASCANRCCGHAKVWYDFKDLIFLHLTTSALPPGQSILNMNQTCRYLDCSGCVLPRTQRPFICTWYICAAQKAVIHSLPKSSTQFLFNSLDALKAGRRRLEEIYMNFVFFDPEISD